MSWAPVPCNPEALRIDKGLVKKGFDIGILEKAELDVENSIGEILKELLEEKLLTDGDDSSYIYVCDIFPSSVVYNHFKRGENGFDKYFRISYKVDGGVYSLDGEPTEVESERVRVDKSLIEKRFDNID